MTVTVAYDDGELVTTVVDDGIGGADPTKGSGLTGLVDRIAAVDGRLDVHSPPAGGTQVVCRIPISQRRIPLRLPRTPKWPPALLDLVLSPPCESPWPTTPYCSVRALPGC